MAPRVVSNVICTAKLDRARCLIPNLHNTAASWYTRTVVVSGQPVKKRLQKCVQINNLCVPAFFTAGHQGACDGGEILRNIQSLGDRCSQRRKGHAATCIGTDPSGQPPFRGRLDRLPSAAHSTPHAGRPGAASARRRRREDQHGRRALASVAGMAVPRAARQSTRNARRRQRSSSPPPPSTRRQPRSQPSQSAQLIP